MAIAPELVSSAPTSERNLGVYHLSPQEISSVRAEIERRGDGSTGNRPTIVGLCLVDSFRENTLTSRAFTEICNVDADGRFEIGDSETLWPDDLQGFVFKRLDIEKVDGIGGYHYKLDVGNKVVFEYSSNKYDGAYVISRLLAISNLWSSCITADPEDVKMLVDWGIVSEEFDVVGRNCGAWLLRPERSDDGHIHVDISRIMIEATQENGYYKTEDISSVFVVRD